MHTITRPTWAEINLDHLAHNMREIRRVVRPGCSIAAVVKADGYGHGAAAIAGTLLENGADRLATAILSEAIQLRKSYPETEIMILGYTPADQADKIIEHRLIATVFDFQTAATISQAAIAHDVRAKVHIKLETGMGRIGLAADPESAFVIKQISALPALDIEGIFTHFAVADEHDKTTTYDQLKRYESVMERLAQIGVPVPLAHVSNSAAIIDLRNFDLDMVRPGIMLYGLYPSGQVSHEAVKLKEVMSLKTRISHVKDLPPGTGVSYGHTYFTRGAERIATLPIGYADGYSRMLTGKAHVELQDRRVPVVGRICMDQCMINVTGLDVKPGDLVTLFGGEGESKIWIEDIAAWLGTNSHEVICRIDKRVPRVYIKNGVPVNIRDYVVELS